MYNFFYFSGWGFFQYVREILQLSLPIDHPVDPPPINFTTLSEKKNYDCDTWHVICDTWHVTCDPWHVTRDIWHIGGGGINILSKFQLLSSYCLWLMILWRYGGKGSLTHRLNKLMTWLFMEQPRLLNTIADVKVSKRFN